jgi:hypothetical protein
MIEIPNREREVGSISNSHTHILEKLMVDRRKRERDDNIYPNAVVTRILTVDFNCYYVDGYYAIL